MSDVKERKSFRERAKEKIKKYAPWVLTAGAIAGSICWVLSSVGGDEVVESTVCEIMDTNLMHSQQPEEPECEMQSEKTHRSSHDVSEHVRNLPTGRNASPQKAESALDHGYNLQPGQTWVESYTTGNKSA